MYRWERAEFFFFFLPSITGVFYIKTCACTLKCSRYLLTHMAMEKSDEVSHSIKHSQSFFLNNESSFGLKTKKNPEHWYLNWCNPSFQKPTHLKVIWTVIICTLFNTEIFDLTLLREKGTPPPIWSGCTSSTPCQQSKWHLFKTICSLASSRDLDYEIDELCGAICISNWVCERAGTWSIRGKKDCQLVN